MSFTADQQVSAPLLLKMRDTMVHRGPDGGGHWISQDGKIGLGHRRLSIIDLSTHAAQPMSNADGSVWVTFNGEIYNHAEIRTELELLGKYQWKTDHSDTEVLLHSYEEWGIECLHKFRGMFAVGIWDSTRRELWLIRDRLGVKPLYYSVYNQKLAFASEIKALLADPDRSRSVNETALFHYLSFLTTPAPDTFFSGIFKIPAGCYLHITEAGDITEHRYWDPLDQEASSVCGSEEAIADSLLSELRNAVKLRKEADVPVGVFLSGGIDSSTNAALFSEDEGKPVKTFSIGYQGQCSSYQNELPYAKKVADLVGAQYYEKLLSVDDLIDFLPQMVRLQDEPIADPVCFPVYFVSQLAREQGVTVCQVGEGADELFCGYPKWRTLLKLQRYNDYPVPDILKKSGLWFLRKLNKENSFAYERLSRGVAGRPIFWGGAEAFSDVHKKKILSPRLREKFLHETSWSAIKPIRERFEKKSLHRGTLDWMTYLDLNVRLPELLLMRVDKMSMGVSLECRVPFLDYKFVELAMRIPESLKVKNGDLKYMLKKAVNGIIPDEIINRKKQGFGVPVHDWFMDKLGAQIKEELNAFCDKTDFFCKEEVNKLIDENKADQVWYLFNFALWWKEYFGAIASDTRNNTCKPI